MNELALLWSSFTTVHGSKARAVIALVGRDQIKASAVSLPFVEPWPHPWQSPLSHRPVVQGGSAITHISQTKEPSSDWFICLHLKDQLKSAWTS